MKINSGMDRARLVTLGAVVLIGGALQAACAEGKPAAAVAKLSSEAGIGPVAVELLQAQDEEIAPARSAKDAIEAYLRSHANWVRGYDKTADRIIDCACIEFAVRNPKTSPTFTALRKEKLSELLLDVRARIAETVSAKASGGSSMTGCGFTVLQQAESVSEENGHYNCQIAILYSWSGEMMKAIGELRSGGPVKFTPGKKSVRGWISDKVKKGALAQMLGPRRYVDDKGNMWFIGISCCAVCDNAGKNEMYREVAELEAASEVASALCSEVTKSRTPNGIRTTQSCGNFRISGNTELWSGTVRHEPSNREMQVVVYGVNSGNGRLFKSK